MNAKNIILCLLFLSVETYSQETVVGFGGGINKDGSHADMEAGYKINSYLTASLTCRLQSIVTHRYGDITENYEWSIDDADFVNFLIIPSLRFSFPILTENDVCWSFYMEPGIMIQPLTYERFEVGYAALGESYNGMTTWSGSAKGDFKTTRFYWQNKFAIQCGSEDVALFAGFELSNQDVYSKRRSVNVDGVSLDRYLPAKVSLCNSMFIGFRACF